jgi:hypothetical protein
MSDTKTLPALVAEMNEIVRQILESGGELTEVLETAFDGVGQELATKTDRYAFMIDRLSSEETFWKEKAEAYSKVAKSCKALRERLNDNIKFAMLSMETKEIAGDEMRFVLSKLAPKVVLNEEKIPDAWKMVVTERVPDKDRIKAALIDGMPVEGATLEPVFSLRKYVNKKG